MQRPSTVPEAAEYIADWQEWGLGERVDGEMSGEWRLWRADGTFVEESSWSRGNCHGTKLRYHDDGTLASSTEYVHGDVRHMVAHRSAAPTRETDVPFDTMPGTIHRVEFRQAHAVAHHQAFFAADGSELDMSGAPLPPRPAGVPAETWFIPNDRQWKAGRWATGVNGVGLQVYWNEAGEPIQVEYYRDNSVAARVGMHNDGNPLVEAYRDGDTEAVERLIGLGLGASPGAVAHAAYEGFPELALRLLNLDGGEPLLADPRVEPGRREVDPAAGWIAGLGSRGGWYVGTVDPATGRPEGDWKLWKHTPFLDRDEYAEASFAGGKLVRVRKYGTVRWDDPGSRRHHDGLLLKEETEFRDGEPTTIRVFEYGFLSTEDVHEPDGTVVRIRFHENGRPERIRRDNSSFVQEEWFDEDGVRLALVEPAAVDVERYTAFDVSGTVTAVGHVRAGGGAEPVGHWRLLKPDGSERGAVTFKPVLVRDRGDLGRVAEAVYLWHQAPTLPGAGEVDWKNLGSYFRGTKDFAFHVTGFAVPDPFAVELAVAHVYDDSLHQGTIEEVTGYVVRFAVAALRTVENPVHAVPVLRFLVEIATRQGQLPAAWAIRRLYRSRPADAAPAEYFAKEGVEPAYHEVLTAFETATPLFAEWATHPDATVCHHAKLLLALTPGEAARSALLAVDADADVLLGLVLPEPDDAVRAVLRTHVEGDDPLLAFCAALTWVRLALPDADPAARILIAALADPQGLDGFGALAFSSGEPTADAATALVRLPAELVLPQVPRLGSALEEVTSINAIRIAGALLDIVFPTDAYQDGAELTGPQREAIAAIAGSDTAWTFNVNLFEVLRYNGLPEDRDALRALVS